jgi:putative methyltransferase (TIGR04325 family)
MATATNPEDFNIVKSWNEALELAKGYQDQKLIEYYVDNMRSSEPWNKWKLSGKTEAQLSERETVFLLFLMIALADLKKDKIFILDIGGGNGYFAHVARKMLPHIELNWLILESEGCANAYKQFESVSNIRWTHELGNETTPDITIFSCSLQYLEKPFEVLDHAIAISRWLLLMRLPLTDEQINQVTVQKVYYEPHDFSWPCWFFSKELFLRRVSMKSTRKLGYRCLDESVLLKDQTIRLENYLISCDDNFA